MSDIRISIEGLSQVLTQISRLPQDVQDEVSDEILDSVFRINGQQRKRAPKDQGGLARGIGFNRKYSGDTVVFEIFSNSEHSGYMEFGTRFRVRVPASLQAIANEMKGKGISSKLKAKEAIYAWCKRKGIDKKAWWPIFKSIMVVGVNPNPYPDGFFFKPIFDEGPQLIQRIQAIVNKYSSKPTSPVVIRPGDFVRNNSITTI